MSEPRGPRSDLGIEGNTARRLFWERCASRPPVNITAYDKESAYQVASWADQMLREWDKRWVSELEPFE